MALRTSEMNSTITRRTVLRGAGVAVALPWLESLPAFASTAGDVPFPKRFAVLFMGNGVNENHWNSEGDGTAMKLSRTLEPLEPIKHKINVIHGLFHKRAVGRGIHPAQTGCLLSGADIQKGSVVKAGITVDQVLANRIGHATPQPSISLACEQPLTGFHETNYSLAYSSHLSWQSADSPVPNEVYPSIAWDNLFENRGSLRNKSVLDAVMEDASALTTKVSSVDKARLDEYLTSVREVEQRVEKLRAGKEKADELAKHRNRPLFAMDRPANGLPEDLREHARLMCDIIAIAFQTDKTRVATLLLARDLGALYYPFLGVAQGHHSASHNNASDGYERISRFHLSQLAYLATKLDSMREGEGTVLDNCCLMWLSNMWIGRKHDNSRLPLVLAGGLGGTLRAGRTLDYTTAGDENRKMSSLFLSLLDRMDVKLDGFGDADARLNNL
jgi:putative Ca2+/H+ antiporter (TMEM165/GDT1 family)